MAKDEKKPSLEELNQEVITLKETIAEKKKEFDSFHGKHKLKINQDHASHPDEAVAKGFKKRKKELTDLRKQRDDLLEQIKGSTPKKERSGGFTQKYTYPSNITTSGDKKKYRAEQRRLAKKDGKTEAKVEKKKESKIPAVEPEKVKKKSEKAAEIPTKKKKVD